MAWAQLIQYIPQILSAVSSMTQKGGQGGQGSAQAESPFPSRVGTGIGYQGVPLTSAPNTGGSKGSDLEEILAAMIQKMTGNPTVRNPDEKVSYESNTSGQSSGSTGDLSNSIGELLKLFATKKE